MTVGNSAFFQSFSDKVKNRNEYEHFRSQIIFEIRIDSPFSERRERPRRPTPDAEVSAVFRSAKEKEKHIREIGSSFSGESPPARKPLKNSFPSL